MALTLFARPSFLLLIGPTGTRFLCFLLALSSLACRSHAFGGGGGYWGYRGRVLSFGIDIAVVPHGRGDS